MEKSAAYVVMRRLGLSPREYFEKQDFIPVMDFNTPATISQLGHGNGGYFRDDTAADRTQREKHCV